MITFLLTGRRFELVRNGAQAGRFYPPYTDY